MNDIKSGPSPQSPVVLIVEEELVLSRVIAKTLGRFELQCLCYSTGEEAIAQVGIHHTAIMLLDYKLPDMTGEEVINRLHEIGIDIPFIAMSGDGDMQTAINMMKLGADDFVVKDAEFVSRLPNIVKHAFERIQMTRELADTQLKLEQSERQYRSLFEGSADGTGIADVSSKQWVFANKSWQNMFGYRAHEIPGLPVSAVHPETERSRISRGLDSISSGEVRRVNDVPCKRKNGSLFYADINVSIQRVNDSDCFVGFFRDVTERRNARAEIDSLARFPAENPSPVMRVGVDGTMLYANKASHPLLNTLGSSKRKKLLAQWSTKLSGVSENKDEAEEVLTIGEKTYSLVFAHIPEMGYVNIYCSDITALLSAQKEKEIIEEQYRQSQKLEAIGQLAGGIAHDFNNILGGINGYAEVLRAKFNQNPEVIKYAGKIVDAALKASNLSRQLLAFARRTRIELQPTDIHACIRETVIMLQHTLPKNITIETSLRAETSTVNGDHGQIGNALLNLAVNARDAMPEGGVLRFETRTMVVGKNSGTRELINLPAGKCIMITIRDTGTGIPENIREKIFDPFFTTKGPDKGTGLGLASVYGTVSLLRGNITVDSEPGKGTRFVMFFPLLEEKDKEEVEEEKEKVDVRC